MRSRSHKDKKHKKEKKHGHKRDKDATPRVVAARQGAPAAATATKSSPAAVTHEPDAHGLLAKAVPPFAHAVAASESDGDSEYGPVPLVAAVGDVG